MFGADKSTHLLEGVAAPTMVPPHRGLGLGLRLGFFTTVAVAGVMAALTGTQLALELRADLHERQARLGESVAPLAADLRTILTRDEAARAVARFHAAYIDQGHINHHLEIVDTSGQIVLGTRNDNVPGQRESLTAVIPLVTPAFGTEPVVLLVTGDNSDFSAARSRRWWAWAVHVGVTALLILALLCIVIRREVTGPIDRLVCGVRKMEQGYWDDMPDPGGAWEIRWLGWRFRTLGQELSRTVEHLVAAERRAYSLDHIAIMASTDTTDAASPTSSPAAPDFRSAVAWLQSQLERLRSADPNEAATYSLAQFTWESHATLAERLGQSELRISLEDAALRVLDPDAFFDVTARIDAERPGLEAWARAREEQIRGAMAARGVPAIEICHRIKHPAGVWKKMRQKSLTFEQVHDLVALRIVAPTEVDCYHALGVIYDLYTLIVGRFKDYIAVPKPNGYRSLHLSVRDPDGAVFEVQIRSVAMHRHAEQGSAAHVNYKDATHVAATAGQGATWQRLLRTLRRWRKLRQDAGSD